MPFFNVPVRPVISKLPAVKANRAVLIPFFLDLTSAPCVSLDVSIIAQGRLHRKNVVPAFGDRTAKHVLVHLRAVGVALVMTQWVVMEHALVRMVLRDLHASCVGIQTNLVVTAMKPVYANMGHVTVD